MINKCRVNNYEYAAIEIDKRLKDVEAELSRLPQVKESEVRINPRTINGKTRYYVYFSGHSKDRKYMGVNNLESVPGIIRNEYTAAVRKNLSKERKLLKSLHTFYKNNSIDSLYSTRHIGKREFITPVRIPTEELLKQFCKIKQNTKPFKDTDSQLITLRGERVRSKNELLIANELYHYKIPYLYEPELTLKDGTVVHPDFVIFNVRTREIIIWEHFGNMNNPYYVEYAVKKIHTYYRNGHTNKDFITTFEYDGSSYSANEINHIIRSALM